MRYLRLYACFLRFSFSRALEFRLDFWFRVGMDTLWYAAHLAFFTLLHEHTDLLGGWTVDQTRIFAAALFVSDAINMTVFSNNLWWFPIFVNRGDLDYYLVRPVSPLFFLSLRDFAANSFVNLLLALGILGWALARYPGPIGPGALGVFLLLLGLGAFLQYALHFLCLIPVFWMHQGRGLMEVSWSAQRLASQPDGIYRGWARRVLTSLLPYALIVSFPVRALFAADLGPLLAHSLLVCLGAFALLVAAWRRGLKAYSSASS